MYSWGVKAIELFEALRGCRSVGAHLKPFFGLAEREHLLGFVYVGYPAGPQPSGKRTPFAQKTVWMDR